MQISIVCVAHMSEGNKYVIRGYRNSLMNDTLKPDTESWCPLIIYIGIESQAKVNAWSAAWQRVDYPNSEIDEARVVVPIDVSHSKKVLTATHW